jgi:L-amino acid N-acyltransferase YncA
MGPDRRGREGWQLTLNYRKAEPGDIQEMQDLLLTEGKNPYNYLPEDGVREHLQAIAAGKTEAILAVSGGRMVGFVSYVWGRVYPQYEPLENREKDHGYIAEAVVAGRWRGEGVGTRLVQLAKEELTKKGFHTIYAMRHAENRASARMLEKANFEEVATFPDPERRHFGSRKTTVCRFVDR